MDELNRLILKEKEKKLIMSRVPKETKKVFIELAEEEFEGDYGMTLKAILDGYMRYHVFYENMNLKLDKIINKINIGNEQKPGKSGIKLMSGRIVEKGGEE